MSFVETGRLCCSHYKGTPSSSVDGLIALLTFNKPCLLKFHFVTNVVIEGNESVRALKQDCFLKNM